MMHCDEETEDQELELCQCMMRLLEWWAVQRTAVRVAEGREAELRRDVNAKYWEACRDENTGLREQLRFARKDVEDAAGELLLPIPEPGTDQAKMMLANRLLKGRLGKLRDAVWKLLDDAKSCADEDEIIDYCEMWEVEHRKLLVD